MASDETVLAQKLQDLQKQLGKKQLFEEAVSSIKSLVRQFYPTASTTLRKLVRNLELSLSSPRRDSPFSLGFGSIKAYLLCFLFVSIPCSQKDLCFFGR